MTRIAEGEMPKAYEPEKVEKKWYQFWLEKGYFSPKMDPEKKPFVIIMPPPNVTGELHLGHALTSTLEDIMVRWHRMKGDPALWLPGMDHAGIATQVVVEQLLAREGTSRHDLGREKFLERVWQWVGKYRGIITEQHQRLGASCDWGKERFTLEEGPSRAVRTAFVRLYHKGLIYRGERIINWCPRCSTALSDLEVEHKETAGHLYYVRYRLADGGREKGFITVATTRPETILGDTAVAVNPEDERFHSMVGREAVLPAIARVIPIVADDAVDPAFGTGAVKITPAHDPVDFEVAQRQGLPSVNILNLDATMNQNAGPYAGLDRWACRQAILADLEKEGLLVKVEPYSHSVGYCDRCQTIIEPIVSQQWFVRMAPLAQPAIEAVERQHITIIPERFTKTYLNWMKDIRDWCISRQLWWGHRIPVWYCRECDQLTVSIDDPLACGYCRSANIVQDPDVLDTWFSSALWPHSTLGWPEDNEELRYFYPTTVMETGYDILFFWVARMIMMGLEDTGEVPFQTVYLHGLVRDERGDKMSKLRGNVLSPGDVIKRYGTDSLRFALSTGTSPGNDIKLSPHKLEAGRNFCNKLWNATRFVARTTEAKPGEIAAPSQPLPVADRWILSRLNRLIANVNTLMQDFQFGEAERQIHDFLWGEYCDWYIEVAKICLRSPSEVVPSPIHTLAHVLETTLRLLHPFMPFITEELWQNIRRHQAPQGNKAESIMISPYPVADETMVDPEAEGEMESIIEIVSSIRNARVQYKVEPARWIEAQIYAGQLLSAITSHSQIIETLARVRPLTILGGRRVEAVGTNVPVLVLKETEVILSAMCTPNFEAEKRRLEKKIERDQNEVLRLEARLKDEAFLVKAPAEVVEKERERLAQYKEGLERLKEELDRLSLIL